MEPGLPEPRLESTVHPPEPLQLGLHEAQSVELTALSPELSEPGPAGAAAATEKGAAATATHKGAAAAKVTHPHPR